jgi:CubicO group peptidase (beta-lactamase class C family)
VFVFPEKPWPVTARALLCHQGGVRHVTDEEWNSTRHYPSVLAALEIFKDDPLVFEPTTRALYSTYGYNLLGAAVEGASGTTYLERLRERVLAPAGADGIRDDSLFELIRRRAHGYQRLQGELYNARLADTSNKIPGGGLAGTAADVARFGAALLAGRLVRPATLRGPLFTPQKLRDGRQTEYTLGFRATRRRNRQEIWHHGGQPRVSNLIYMLPDRGLVVTLLCNLEGVSPGLLELAREIADLVLETPLLRR